jgi:hypothetical protein
VPAGPSVGSVARTRASSASILNLTSAYWVGKSGGVSAAIGGIVAEWRERRRHAYRVLAMDDDPLLGCRLKLQGAWRHRQALSVELETFLQRADTEPSPLRLGVIVGDFLHNLRCVLDHLVWQLVLSNGQTPSVRNQFPTHPRPTRRARRDTSAAWQRSTR